MRKLILIGAAMLLVTSCSKKATDSDGDGKITAEEVKAELAGGGKMAMKAGEWEVKINFSDVSGEGIPAAAKPAILEQIGKANISKSCVTQEQTNKPGADLFGSPAEANCIFAKFDRSGQNVLIDMICKPGGTMKLHSKMEGSFGEESYKMTMEQNIEGIATGPFTLKGTINGRRLGDCPA
jgi:Protein of unknown function (DUF3617)